MLLIHIIIAVLSLVWSTITLIKPSIAKLRVSYAMTGGVLATGVLLVVFNHAVIVQACTSGLSYLVVSLSLTAIGHHRLQKTIN